MPIELGTYYILLCVKCYFLFTFMICGLCTGISIFKFFCRNAKAGTWTIVCIGRVKQMLKLGCYSICRFFIAWLLIILFLNKPFKFNVLFNFHPKQPVYLKVAIFHCTECGEVYHEGQGICICHWGFGNLGFGDLQLVLLLAVVATAGYFYAIGKSQDMA